MCDLLERQSQSISVRNFQHPADKGTAWMMVRRCICRNSKAATGSKLGEEKVVVLKGDPVSEKYCSISSGTNSIVLR